MQNNNKQKFAVGLVVGVARVGLRNIEPVIYIGKNIIWSIYFTSGLQIEIESVKKAILLDVNFNQ